ncbi:MAG: metallophosphoesterase family protein [Treponema sp.]|nr:metallophosphoesterase family protein [Treponema sp.]
MKFLVLSDIHGNIDALDKLDEQFSQADAVLFAGDFARFKHPETGLPVLEKLLTKHEVIFSVIGNCDEPEFLAEIEARDCSIQKALVFHEGLAFSGSGGATPFTNDTPNERPEEEILEDFALVTQATEQQWDNLIMIMHNPPKDTKCDTVPGGIHVGGPLSAELIKKIQPLAVITGHIHESAGIDKIGNTTVINPGALLEGKYAWLEVEKTDGSWNVTKAELQSL